MNFKLQILYHLINFKITKIVYSNNLDRLRAIRFKKLLKVLSKSRFYETFLRPGITLEAFPLIDKKIFTDNFNDINTCNIKKAESYKLALEAEQSREFTPAIKGITIGLSSGTSGNRGIFLASEKERARWAACIIERVIGFSFSRRKVAFFLRANSNLYGSVQSSLIQFNFFDLFQPITDNINRLQQLQPHILVAQPSMLLEIAKAMRNKELTIAPVKVISVAEVLTPEDSTFLSNIFKQFIHQVYQCTEGFLATTCKLGTLHFNEDFLVIGKRYIDAEHTRFHPVITDLMRSSQPVVRYELNDIIIEKKDCPCGSKMMAIEQIEGRSDDILIFETSNKEQVKIFPDFFRRAIITSNEEIEDYAVIQNAKDALLLYIRPYSKEAYSLATEAIKSLLEVYHVTAVSITSTSSNCHQQGNKLRRIKNETAQTC